MVKIILLDGETEVLLSNLYDKESFLQKKLGELYFIRWKIEAAYAKQKTSYRW